MKKAFVSILIVLGFNSNAQSIIGLFDTKDSMNIIHLVDTVLSATGANYKLYKIDSSGNGSPELIQYGYISDDKKELRISYKRYKHFGNATFSIPDTLYYQLNTIQGYYPHIFNFWKYYIDTSADLSQTRLDGYGKRITVPSNAAYPHWVDLSRNGDGWIIRNN